MTLKINMTEENISQQFRLKRIDETRNYFIQEIKQIDIMSKKYKKYKRLQITLKNHLY